MDGIHTRCDPTTTEGKPMTDQEQDTQVAVVDTKPLDSAMALEAVDRAAISTQISTAKAYPRSIEKFRRDALTLATADEETAGSMFYVMPRGGKDIEGPSARLAEIVLMCWGNIRADGGIEAVESDHVVAYGMCADLENNTAVRTRVKRRILDKHGQRFGPDMIQTTSNAAISIAIRNAVFKVVPFAVVRPIYLAARSASVSGDTMASKRENMLAWFAKEGVEPDEIFEWLGIPGLADVGEDELVRLRGVKTAIQEGDLTAATAFHDRTEPSNEVAELNEELGL